MRIVILEVVTAGGFGDANPPKSNWPPAPTTIPHSLWQEAVAMVSGLTVDCCEAFESLEAIEPLQSFEHGDQSRPISEAEFPVGTRCVPWLLGSLFSTQLLAESIHPQAVNTFWNLGDPNGSSLDRIDSNWLPILNSVLPRVESSSADDLAAQVECWDPIREQPLVTAQVFLPGAAGWSLLAGNRSQGLTSSATTPLWKRTSIATIAVADPTRLSQQWKEAVKNSDAAILIAPQPDMQRWISALGSLAHKVLSWPLELIIRAEDKRYLTSVPSLVISSLDHGWRFAAPDSNSPAVARDKDDYLLQSYATRLATATTWALKPTNQCGGSDVWRISLVAPLSEFASAKRVVQRLRELVPCDTLGEQELLWSPWITGEAGSLSLFATSTGWWCFPPCRQILRFEDVAVPPELLPWVKQLQKVSYGGAELDPQLLQSGTVDLLWQQFAAKLELHERRAIRGWFGIDFVAATPEQATLIEVNPRLTSSYNLLRQLRWA